MGYRCFSKKVWRICRKVTWISRVFCLKSYSISPWIFKPYCFSSSVCHFVSPSVRQSLNPAVHQSFEFQSSSELCELSLGPGLVCNQLMKMNDEVRASFRFKGAGYQCYQLGSRKSYYLSPPATKREGQGADKEYTTIFPRKKCPAINRRTFFAASKQK